MNLYFRLIFVILNAFRRSTIVESNLYNEITTHVMPNDLDINLHMNNGRYLTICDLTRVDLFVRSGLAKVMLKNNWHPIVAANSMTFIRPLSLFDKIKVTMEITHVDEKFFYSVHNIYKKGALVAEGTSKAVVIGKKGSLNPSFVIEKVVEYQAEKAN